MTKRPGETEELAYGLWRDVLLMQQASIAHPLVARHYLGILHEAEERLNNLIKELEHGK